MNAESFLDAVREDNETALSRIGSSKMLYALTGGEMDAGPIATAVATDAAHAERLFSTWADAADSEDAAGTFGDAADTAAEIVGATGAEPTDDERPLYDVLADLSGTRDRAAGLAAQSLVALKLTEQVVGFYVGDADPTTARTYRGLKEDLEDQRDAAAALLAAACESEDDWDAARAVADDAVGATYEFYVETLESMGIEPKNVC